MVKATKYFVFENEEFENVKEIEYNRWLKEDWKKFKPHLFSKLIGGIVYTVQAFYHGDVTKGNRFKPFTIFYIEGNKHKMRYFRKWVAFKCHYDKLIGKLNQLETQHFRTIKLRRFKAEDSIFMAANAG